MKYYDYTGVIHFHSDFSFDGHVGLDKIIDAAEKNGIDFLMLTDHDHLQARDEGREGWNGKVLLIVGEEISPRFNHYLAFNIDKPIEKPEDAEGRQPQKYIDAVNDAGGFGFIAHPDHEGTETFHVKHYPWTDWTVDGYVGIGIWDFMTDWQSSLRKCLPALMSFFFPAFFLRGPCRKTLERWDSFNETKKIVGIGELDNHGSIVKIGAVKVAVFPFERAFKFVRTHVCTQEPLSGDKAKDISLLYKSLQHGRCYVAMEYFQAAKGFSFTITQKNEEYFMGDSLMLEAKARLDISLPVRALVRVIKDGALIAEEMNHKIALYVSQRGVYRVEAYLKRYGKWRPWIFSNHIYAN
ncbi:MAG: PHP domain-containing protein [Smithella sp.]